MTAPNHIPLLLDGSQGEGGGQILRTALALSLVTGRPFRIVRIRAGRPKPGLLRQHLACVEAAAQIGSATTEGALLGSSELTFTPGSIVAGEYTFRIASAGSTMLLLQTVLMPLLSTGKPSTLVLEGGTHNPFAPPLPFMEQAFAPLMRRIGYPMDLTLERPGFYPNGGGRCRVTLSPAVERFPLHLDAASPVDRDAISVVALVAGLPKHVGEREVSRVRDRLGFPATQAEVQTHANAVGPGNTLHVSMPAGRFANVVTGFGSPKVRAEQVADAAASAAEAFLTHAAAVEEHLADQLLLPLALARGGSFTTTEPSGHCRTNIDIIQQFLNVPIISEPQGPGVWRITVSPRS